MKKRYTKAVKVIGLDLARHVLQIYGTDESGEVVMRKQLKRNRILRYFTRLKPALVDLQACRGAHYWSRAFSQSGHSVRMMAASFVKP